MVLSHLILNDMMKVKGHIARLALCLQDDDPRIAGLAQVFFHELSHKASKVPCRPAAACRVRLPPIAPCMHAEGPTPPPRQRGCMRVSSDMHRSYYAQKLRC